MYFPFFQYGCSLEINSQRTAAYVSNAADVCVDGDIRSYMDLKCNCAPLGYVINDNDTVSVATYTTPAGDQAPWYDASIPESAKFFGFMIEDVTMNSVASRNVKSRISTSGGGVLGPIRNKERRLEFTVLMFGCTEEAMEYGMRFLTDALGSPGCDDGCTLCDAEFRDSCPTVDGTFASMQKGRWILKNVGAVEGPIRQADPLEGSSCNLRRVKFTLVSEMPWKFKCPVVECNAIPFAASLTDGTNCGNWSDILCGENDVACSVNEDLVIGETGLIISVVAGNVPLQHIRIAIRPDKFGYECNAGNRPDGYQRVEPCDEIYIPSIPANSTFVYDTSIESIQVVFAGGGAYDGTPYVSTRVGSPPTFPTLRCGSFCVSVSVSECSVVGNPTCTIKSVHREI